MKKVLIVDDEEPLIKIMASQFTKENIEVLTASNGAEGLDIALHNFPDLIILDIIMPVMDGITMLEKLRQNKWGTTVPVMILTNRDDSKNMSIVMNNKIIRYYIKSDTKLEVIVQEAKEILLG